MNLLSILFPQTIYKTSSKFSGEIEVIDHVFERRLVVGGLTQSGGILTGIWKKTLNELRIKNYELRIKNVLILGLGGGTAAEVINKQWPEAKIIGVEIDPVIVEVGKKYFHLGNVKNLEIVITDAVDYISSHPKLVSGSHREMPKLVRHDNEGKFDLIIVDLYKGFSIEKNLQNKAFLQKIAQKLAKNGFVIFNVIPRQNDNFEAKIFLDKLSNIFQDYFCKRIITNNIFFCKNPTPKGGDLSMAKKKKKKRK